MTTLVSSFLPLSLLNPRSNPNSPKLHPFSSSSIPTITTSILNSISEISEIRVCTNRTCRRQGSSQTLETLTGIAPPNVVVKSCGCLGRCGSGPNIVALPGPTMINHCGTPNRAAAVLVKVLGGGTELEEEARKCLEALALRKRAESELSSGNLSEAESLYSQAINLKPFGGLHVAYVGRSSVLLKMGNFTGALADAEKALTIAPNYVEAYICRGDAFTGLEQLDEAEAAYSMALEKDPSIRRSKSFKPFKFRGNDECVTAHTKRYMNRADVQRALHVKSTKVSHPWRTCSDVVRGSWKDSRKTMLPVLRNLIASGLRIWVYSGDTDAVIPLTSTRYSINAMNLKVLTEWYAWYDQHKVGGWSQIYEGLTLVTVRGAGHEVPLGRPRLATVLFRHFLENVPLPSVVGEFHG